MKKVNCFEDYSLVCGAQLGDRPMTSDHHYGIGGKEKAETNTSGPSSFCVLSPLIEVTVILNNTCFVFFFFRLMLTNHRLNENGK